MGQLEDTALRARLFELYAEIYEASKTTFLGCTEIGCGELCEDVEFIQGLEPAGIYDSACSRDGVQVFNGSYVFLPWEHEFIEQRTGVKAKWLVRNIGGLPTAAIDGSSAGEDDRCAYYEPFSAHCPVVFDRPILCRSYPIIPELNVETGQLDVYVEMLCPYSQLFTTRKEYYQLWVESFAKLASVLPHQFWLELHELMSSSIRLLAASYQLPLRPHTVRAPILTQPLVYPDWKEAITKMRSKRDLVQLKSKPQLVAAAE